METEVIVLPWVQDFLKNLDHDIESEMQVTINMLRLYGHNLAMPDAKPVGKGLWELRTKLDRLSASSTDFVIDKQCFSSLLRSNIRQYEGKISILRRSVSEPIANSIASALYFII